MAVSKEWVDQAIDEVLEPAWARERRRALQRVVVGCALRWLLGMTAVIGLAVGVSLASGMAVPWVFLVMAGVLAAFCAAPRSAELRHLRR